MTRIYDLPSIPDTELVPTTSVMPISDGIITKKITLGRMKSLINSVATTSSLGVVKVGPGLAIDGDGSLRVQNFSNYTLPIATPTVLGGIKIGESLVISPQGVLSTAYPLVPSDTNTFGLVKIGSGIDVTGGVISVPEVDFSHFLDAGFTMGVSNDLRVFIDNGDAPTLYSISTIDLTVKDLTATDEEINIQLAPLGVTSSLGATTAALLPDVDGVSLGAPLAPWVDVYASTFHGDVVGTSSQADTLLVLDDGIYRNAKVVADAHTIAARDSLGNLTANVFNGDLLGNAASASQADLLKVGAFYRATSVSSPNSGIANTVVVRDASGNINSTNFNGVATQADTLKLGASYVVSDTASTPNTIVGRDSSANITAAHFIGIATNATYADLAEIYEPDAEYDEGTVVVFGGDKEITVTTQKADHRVAGVISTKPAYLMNSDASGLPVALRGKVPVKVFGQVQKGDLLVSSAVPGYAMSVQGSLTYGQAVFAKSLENKSNLDRGVIMAVIL